MRSAGRTAPGVSMRRTSKSQAAGHISIGPSILPARQSSSCSSKCDLIAAKMFLRLALSRGGPEPRVINVDGHPAYASAVAELKQTGELGRRCRCRTAPYLNNVIEQDHRFVKKRITASLGFRSVERCL